MSSKPVKPRVLLVDDYPDAREMYSEYLQFSGFDVIEATNGMEALKSAVEHTAAVFLIDSTGRIRGAFPIAAKRGGVHSEAQSVAGAVRLVATSTP